MRQDKILVTEHLEERGLRILRDGADLTSHDLMPQDTFRELLPQVDAVIIRSAHRMTKELLESAPRLRVVARAGAGVDNIDLDAATARGVIVLNTPGANANAAAEHTFALLLSLVRHVRTADIHVRGGGWDRQAFIGTELRGRTLGIIGIGRVGGSVARIARGFGMEVLAYDPYVSEETVRARGAEKIGDLETLASRSEILTIHTPKTGPRLDEALLSRLPKGAFVMNVARGGLLDESALIRLLDAGHLAGGAIDVFEEEPPKRRDLLDRDDIVVTCHLGGSTEDALTTISERVAKAVLKALDGEIPEEAVNLPYPADTPFAPSDLLRAATDVGRLLAAGGQPGQRLVVAMGGPGTDEALPIASRAVLTGLLQGTADVPVNPVNAALIAEGRGITLSLLRQEETGPVRIAAHFAKAPERVVELTVESPMRIVRLAGGRFDLRVPPHILVTEHEDKPGVVGRVGSLVGEAGVNIGNLELDRDVPGGTAVMALGLDDAPPQELMDRLTGLREVRRAYAVPMETADREPAARGADL